jgi:hypothetical protein
LSGLSEKEVDKQKDKEKGKDKDKAHKGYKEKKDKDRNSLTAGPQGPRGPEGPQGQQGPEGPHGLAGPQGPQGADGARGENGDSGVLGFGSLNGSTVQPLRAGGHVFFDESGPQLETVTIGETQILVLSNGIYEIMAHLLLEGPVGSVAVFNLERNGESVAATTFSRMLLGQDSVSVIHQLSLDANDYISIATNNVNGVVHYKDRCLTIKRLS